MSGATHVMHGMNGMDVFLSSGQVSSLTIAAGEDNCVQRRR